MKKRTPTCNYDEDRMYNISRLSSSPICKGTFFGNL